MVLTKIDFGKELKKKLSQQEDVYQIAEWSHKIYLEYEDLNDHVFLRSLLSLSMMELGPDFFYSIEELNSIADILISGKDIDLNPD